MISRAEIEVEVCMPGYTHLQRAQPIRWSHWICSYAFAFASDLERLGEVIKRVNKSPLGCGALAGNPFGVDRDAMARELGFDGLLMNSLAAVGDRKFAIETMQWAAELMGDVSRISEDLIIYSSAEFGFVKLADAYSTGSSLMPQKVINSSCFSTPSNFSSEKSGQLRIAARKERPSHGPDDRAYGVHQSKYLTSYVVLHHVLTSSQGLPSTYNKYAQTFGVLVLRLCLGYY